MRKKKKEGVRTPTPRVLLQNIYKRLDYILHTQQHHHAPSPHNSPRVIYTSHKLVFTSNLVFRKKVRKKTKQERLKNSLIKLWVKIACKISFYLAFDTDFLFILRVRTLYSLINTLSNYNMIDLCKYLCRIK